MNVLKRPHTVTHDNGDGTVTTITTSYKADGTKVTKKKTMPKHIPENEDRGTGEYFQKRSSLTMEALDQVKSELRKVLGVPHADNNLFASKVNRAIPAQIFLIASQDDVTQAQESDSAKRKYGLPDIPNTRSDSGSLATCALLQMLFENPQKCMPTKSATPYDCRQLLQEIQQRVKRCSSLQEANPVISSSRPLGPPALKSGQFAPFYVVPPGFTGTRRALLICVVSGEGDDLKGPPNDIQYVAHFLKTHCGFKDKDITELRDDKYAPSSSRRSTRQNILDGFSKMIKQSKPNDVCFIQYSGHGGRLGDNLYILPSDYKEVGQIMDDEILVDLIKYLPADVHTTMLVDCCYSGVIGDLPYVLTSKGGVAASQQEIGTYYDIDTRQEMKEKEERGDPEYAEKKQARSKWRNVNRIATVAKAYAQEAAIAAGEASKVASKKAGEASKAASKAAGKAAEQAREAAGKAAEQARAKAADYRRSQTGPAAPRGRKRTDEENARVGRPVSPTRGKTTGSAAEAPDTSKKGEKPALRRVATAPNPQGMPPLRRTRTADPNADVPSPAARSTPTAAPAPARVSRRNRAGGDDTSRSTPYSSTTSEQTKIPIRRSKTSDDPFSSASRSTPYASTAGEQTKIPVRRTQTSDDPAMSGSHRQQARSTPYASTTGEQTKMPFRRAQTTDNTFIGGTHRQDRSTPYSGGGGTPEKIPVRRTKTNEEIAREQEEAARRAAVGRRDEGVSRSIPHPNSSGSSDWEEEARREAVERSRREAAAARGAKSMDDSSGRNRMDGSAWEDQARREAVERSRREAAAARGAKMDESAREYEEAARREAVERSRREAAEEHARQEAVERSRREAAARKEAEERARIAEADEAARKEAIERSRREAANEFEEAARREAVERSRREAAEARSGRGK